MFQLFFSWIFFSSASVTTVRKIAVFSSHLLLVILSWSFCLFLIIFFSYISFPLNQTKYLFMIFHYFFYLAKMDKNITTEETKLQFFWSWGKSWRKYRIKHPFFILIICMFLQRSILIFCNFFTKVKVKSQNVFSFWHVRACFLCANCFYFVFYVSILFSVNC